MENNSHEDIKKKAGDFIDQILKPVDYSKAIVHFLQKKWQLFSGQLIASHSRPSMLERKNNWTLHIAVEHSMWSQEISFQKYAILTKINDQLLITGIEITELRFHIQNNIDSNIGPIKKSQKIKIEDSLEKDDISLDEKTKKLLASITDPKLKNSFLNIAKYLIRESKKTD